MEDRNKPGGVFCLSKRDFDKPVAGKQDPRHCYPHQFLLKSFGFPGTKTAWKRFLLWKIGFPAAKIVSHPPYTPLGAIEIREDFGPLEFSCFFDRLCKHTYICTCYSNLPKLTVGRCFLFFIFFFHLFCMRMKQFQRSCLNAGELRLFRICKLEFNPRRSYRVTVTYFAFICC